MCPNKSADLCGGSECKGNYYEKSFVYYAADRRLGDARDHQSG